VPLASWFDRGSRSFFAEFDRKRRFYLGPAMQPKVRKSVYVTREVIDAAQSRGLALGEYLNHLHASQRSLRVAHVTSVYRGFALLEMARVPVDPAYYDLVNGVMGEEDGLAFRSLASSGKPHALPKAAAQLLGPDTRVAAVEAIFMASFRAGVMHEGYLEAARLLEATLYR
jgi:hypothetical protein